jgi:Fibronectin type III domain
MANRPILQNIMNAALSGVRAMPSKDSSADNSSEFASDRAQYYRSYDSNPVPLNKKWMGSRDASDVARRRRTNGVAIGSFNANGEIVSFATKETLTASRALQRARSAGAIVPPKVSKKIGFSVPSEPTNLQIDSFDDGALTISFVPPTSDGNSTILGYKYTLNSGTTFSSLFTENPFTIQGLNNGQQYPIQIIAVNSVGDSALSTPIVGIPCTVPSEPDIVSIVAGNGYVTIVLNESESTGGSSIISYTITTPQDTNISSTYEVIESTSYPVSVIISGLTNGTSYTFNIVATNRAGDSIPAVSSSVTPANVPGAPTIVSATGGNQQITITFTAPGNNGGSAITNYAYSLNGTDYTDFGIISPVTITGLEAGTTYTIYLKAKNANGYGTASASASATTANDEPSAPPAPTNLVAIPRNGKVTIRFTQSSDGGSPITNYEYSDDDGETYTPFNPQDTSSPVTINNLMNGTTYAIRLKAVNSIGSSPGSDSIIATPSSSISNNIYNSLSASSKNAYDAAEDNTWIKITSAEYATLQTNVTYTKKVGTNDTIFNAAGLGNFSNSSAMFVANVPSASQPDVSANNFLYAFAVRYLSKTNNEKMKVYVNNSTSNNSSGFVTVGNYLPEVKGASPTSFVAGSNYYVLKVPTISYSTSGLLGMYSGTDQVDGYPSGYLMCYVAGSPPGSGIKYKAKSTEPDTTDVLGFGMLATGPYGMGIQGLTTSVVQW